MLNYVMLFFIAEILQDMNSPEDYDCKALHYIIKCVIVFVNSSSKGRNDDDDIISSHIESCAGKVFL